MVPTTNDDSQAAFQNAKNIGIGEVGHVGGGGGGGGVVVVVVGVGVESRRDWKPACALSGVQTGTVADCWPELRVLCYRDTGIHDQHS